MQLLTAKLPAGMLWAAQVAEGVSGEEGALCDSPEEEAAPPVLASGGRL